MVRKESMKEEKNLTTWGLSAMNMWETSDMIANDFLHAPTHVNKRLCPSVCPLVGYAFVRRSTRRKYWPTWPCLLKKDRVDYICILISTGFLKHALIFYSPRNKQKDHSERGERMTLMNKNTLEIWYNSLEGTGKSWLLNPNVVKSHDQFLLIFL